MSDQYSTPPSDGEALETNPWSDQGRRIRWERDAKDNRRIVILDAVTGAVIAVVNSLFDLVFR